MTTGEIYISTTWAASTSFIPFDWGMKPAHDVHLGNRENRGEYATTAYLTGIWENQLYESDMKDYIGTGFTRTGRALSSRGYSGIIEQAGGLGSMYSDSPGNAFRPGTVLEVKIRKIKAMKSSPNRSGVQVNRQMLKGNKLVFRYVAQGELARP